MENYTHYIMETFFSSNQGKFHSYYLSNTGNEYHNNYNFLILINFTSQDFFYQSPSGTIIHFRVQDN